MAGGGVGGGVGPKENHFSSQKDNIFRYRHDGGFQKYHRESTAYPMTLSFSKYY